MHSTLELWVRSHNGQVKNHGPSDRAAVVACFRDTDWDAEIAEYDPDKDSADHTLPAMGVSSSDDSYSCDITPADSESCAVNLCFLRPGKFLGLFSVQKNRQRHLASFPRQEVPALLETVFQGDIDALEKLES